MSTQPPQVKMKQHPNQTNGVVATKPKRTKPTEPKPKPKPKHPVWSLPVVVILPLALVTAIGHFFGPGPKYEALAKPIWFPPLWVIHAGSVMSTLLMSAAAWFVWASGGFTLDSDPLPLYLAQVSLSIVWDPLVLTMGVPSVGFGFCLVHVGTVAVCHWMFGEVNLSSRHFVKPCLAWAVYLTVVTFNLIYL